MPNKIYPVDIGSQLQVETPNLGRASGGLGGRLPSLNLNPLVALQAKLAEKEYDARMKRILDRDASVSDILNSKKGANDINSFYGTEAQFNPYQEGILRKNMEAIQDVALNYSKQDVKSLSGYSDNEFRVKVDKLRNDPSVMGVLREAIELDAFTKANKGNAYHPVLKAKIDEIAHNEDGNTKGAWDYLHNADRYKLTEVDESKDIDALSKFAVDTISKTPVEGMIQTSKTMIPASTRSFIKQKYGKNFINDYEMGSSYTGDARAIPEGMTVDQYVDYRTEQMAKKYDAAVDKTLQSDPVFTHARATAEQEQRHQNALEQERVKNENAKDREKQRQENQLKIQEDKSERSKGFIEGLKNLGEDKAKRIKEKNPDLDDKAIVEASDKINKTGKSSADVEKEVAEKAREVRANVSSEVMAAKTENINTTIKDAKKNEVDGTFDKDVIFRIAGNDGDHSLAVESETPKKGFGKGPVGDSGASTIFEKATHQVIRGGKRYTQGYILTTNKKYYDDLPDYYKTSDYRKQTGVGKVSPEEMKKATNQPFQSGIGAPDYYRVPIEIEDGKLSSSYNGQRSLLAKKIAQLESKDSNIPNASKESNASGNYQFIPSTFKAVAKRNWDKLTQDEKDLVNQIPDDPKQDGKTYHSIMSQLEGLQHKLFREDWENYLSTEVDKIKKAGIGKDLPELALAYLVHHQGSSQAAIDYLKYPQASTIKDKDGLEGRLKEIKDMVEKDPDLGLGIGMLTGVNEDKVAWGAVPAVSPQAPSKINTDETQKQAQKEKPKVEGKKDTVKRKKIVFE